MSRRRYTLADCEELASRHLALYNELEERGLGQSAKAQEHYRKATFWLHRVNKITGDA